MLFQSDPFVAPLFKVKPYVQNPQKAGVIAPPKGALPLIAPLTQRQKEPLTPRLYRIMQGIRSISACAHQDAAIDANDTLWIWGAHKMALSPEGVYSIDTRQNVNYVPKKRMENVSMASCGAFHTMCITKDNRLWGWGENAFGQLGLGDEEERLEAELIMEDVRFVFCNRNQTYAIKLDGTLWGWGINEFNTIPGAPWGWNATSGEPAVCHTPRLIMDNVKSVTSNGKIAMAIRADGTLWGWGINTAGVIFSEEEYTICAPTPFMEGVRTVSLPSLDSHLACFAVTENGNLYSLAGNSPGTMITYQVACREGRGPIKVLEGVRDVQVGHLFSLILLVDGRLFSTGDNALGQCGTGKDTATRFYAPKMVMADAIDMAAGRTHGMGLQRNGDLWIWGGPYGSSAKSCLEKTTC